eukprot:473712_1
MRRKKPSIPHDLYVDQEAAKALQCAICLDTIDNATEVGCNKGHIFCQKCVDVLKESTRSIRIYRCPMCRGGCEESRVHHVQHIDRQINSLKVKCKNHRVGSLKKIIVQKAKLGSYNKREADDSDNKEALPLILRRSARIKKNTENKVGCKRKFRDDEHEEITSEEISAKRRKLNSNEYMETCNWIGSRSEYYDHMKICPLELVKCHYCHKLMLRKEWEIHCETCISLPIRCEQCHYRGIPRNKMSI